MKSLVICSGGLDSVSMAIILSSQVTEMKLLTFEYGQKGRKEINSVIGIADELNVRYQILDLSYAQALFGENQLTSPKQEIEGDYQPSVVVPLRNALFLQNAMIMAHVESFDSVVLGSHIDDIEEVNGERLYPDCSVEFFKTFELACKFGTFKSDRPVRIDSASIRGWSKKELIQRANRVKPKLLGLTWSCYHSGTLHCGECESCINRKKAFTAANIEDPTQYLK